MGNQNIVKIDTESPKKEQAGNQNQRHNETALRNRYGGTCHDLSLGQRTVQMNVSSIDGEPGMRGEGRERGCHFMWVPVMEMPRCWSTAATAIGVSSTEIQKPSINGVVRTSNKRSLVRTKEESQRGYFFRSRHSTDGLGLF